MSTPDTPAHAESTTSKIRDMRVEMAHLVSNSQVAPQVRAVPSPLRRRVSKSELSSRLASATRSQLALERAVFQLDMTGRGCAGLGHPVTQGGAVERPTCQTGRWGCFLVVLDRPVFQRRGRAAALAKASAGRSG